MMYLLDVIVQATVGYFGGASKYQFGIVTLFDASEPGSAFACRRQQMKG